MSVTASVSPPRPAESLICRLLDYRDAALPAANGNLCASLARI